MSDRRDKMAGVLLACGLFLAAAANAAGANPGAGREDWLTLFNGRDLDGWTAKIRHHPAGENTADTFRVREGLLTVAYDGYDDFNAQFGHLFYKVPFAYYRLRVEYRFLDEFAPNAPDWAIRNSGVMFHAQAPGTMPTEQDFPISLEFQFLGGLGDRQARPTGSVCSPGTHIEYDGRFNDTHCISSTAPTFDGDQWVQAEALVLGGDRIAHFINGDKVIEYAHPTYGGGVVSGHRPEMKPDGQALTSGYIALQSEGSAIQFRRVELLNLQGCMDPQAQNFKRYFVAADPQSCRY